MSNDNLISPEIYGPNPPRTGEFASRAVPVQPPVVPLGRVEEDKERYASLIARVISLTFAGCAFVLITGIFAVVLIRPTEAETLLSKAAVPALTQVGTFLTSTFGSLLAFVLGYYFKEKTSKD